MTPAPAHPATYGLRSTLAGILVNLALAIVKGVAGFVGNSYALVADGIESLTDVFSSFVVYIGLRLSMRPPDANHPYGHGKAEPMAGVIVSVGLIIAAALIAYESIQEIKRPHNMPAPFTLLVLPIVVVAKEMMFRFVSRVGANIQSGAVQTDAWHHRSDAITSALAFVGIAIALLGGEGWESADDWAALLASIVIAFNACLLLRPAVQELGDTVPTTQLHEAIRLVANTVPGVRETEKCFVRKMGFDYYVDLHIIVDGNLSVRRGHLIGHNVKDAIQSAYPRVADVLVHVEPHDRE
ncbi:MAG TPA: cation diffusion facilitator family transporter [Bryobacteraceae bacterium]|nr:cation diffusion facilitator family transporter [Bryobacteraceae bacterium]